MKMSVFNATLLLIAVSTCLLPTTNAETFQVTFTRGQSNFYIEEHTGASKVSNSSRGNNPLDGYGFNTFHIFEGEETQEEKDNTTTIILLKNTELPTQLSQTAMDIITVIWYVATFLALAAFFLLMTCTDRRNRSNGSGNNGEAPRPPPSPSPSYSEFAPPSYETVMKMQLAAKTSIFVIPFSVDEMCKNNSDANTNITTNANANNNNNNNNNSSNCNNNQNIIANNAADNAATTPAITFYTINELQKLGS